MESIHWPLSMAQENIDAQETVAAGTDVNCLYFVLRLGTVDFDCLDRAVNLFLKNNEGPRTRIYNNNGTTEQSIEPYVETTLPFFDFSGLSEAEQEVRFRQWGQRPFRYEEAALYEFRILKLSPESGGLFCKFHHIWCDGWATGLIWSEILGHYTDLLHGVVPSGAKPSFTELLPKDQEYRESNCLQEDRRFWEDYLSGAVSTELYLTPTQRMDTTADREVFQMDQALSEEIRAFAVKNGLSPYLIFMAAMLIYQVGSRDCEEAVFGLPRLNRDSPREREMVAMCVAEIPLRMTPNPEDSFLQVCQSISAEAEKVVVHKKYPLKKIVESRREQNGTGTDLILCSVSYQKTKIFGEEVPCDVWFGSPANMSELLIWHILELFEGGPYTVFYDYRCSLYSRDAVCRMHRALQGILAQGISQPEKKAGDFAVVSPEEEQLLKRLGCGPRSVDCEETALTLWKRQLKKSPDRLAVRGEDGEYTYRQLEERSNAVAAALCKAGAGAGGLTAIMLPRGACVAAAALGIWKAGGGFVWLDPSYPRERASFLLRDSGAMNIITTERLLPMLPESGAVPLLFEAMENADPPKAECVPETLCYCIYTSGTTGCPKGVLIEHRGLANLARPDSSELVAAVAEYGRVVLAVGSFSFDISILEMFVPLLNGVSVVVASGRELEDPELLAASMVKNEINTLFVTPSRLLSYLEYQEFRGAMAKVEVLMSGGEPFPAGLYERLRSIAASLHIFNAYGPTETSIVASSCEVTGPTASLGTLVKGFTAHVLGKRLQKLPVGFVGELCIGGVGLARGYRNLPEETARRMIVWNGERLYRTGDLVRFSDRGELLYLGRMDSQVKLRGLRIELSGVEAVLAGAQGVTSCCVLVNGAGAEQYLCAFYTAEHELPVIELSGYLSRKLPSYMVPSVFAWLPEMPMTLNGKTDMEALAAHGAKFQPEYSEPVTKEQQQLCGILQELLHRETVGITDNFFELGGNSLLAARFVVEGKALGFHFSYGDVFANPTVAALCAKTVTAVENPLREELDRIDNAGLNPLLCWHDTWKEVPNPSSILLAGATGFLGLHVLRELIQSTQAVIYCLVRGKEGLTAEQRLKNMLFYYFEDSYEQLFGKRLFVLTGDVTREGVLDEMPESLEMIFNCAADVSHYSYGGAMYGVNVSGVKNLMTLCRRCGAGLLHVSTPTVGQFCISGQTQEKEVLTEEDFYFGQDLSNEYAATKFLAEREVLLAAREGLPVKIARVGNLQGRYSDGEFQINHASNAFISSLKAYVRLGFAPKDVWEKKVDYSPVDKTAEALCALLRVDTPQPVFHVFNGHRSAYSMAFEAMEKLGHTIEPVGGGEYRKRIRETLDDPARREVLTDIISELTGELEGHYTLDYDGGRTDGLLRQLGFIWPEVTGEYLFSCLMNLDLLGAFERLDAEGGS